MVIHVLNLDFVNLEVHFLGKGESWKPEVGLNV